MLMGKMDGKERGFPSSSSSASSMPMDLIPNVWGLHTLILGWVATSVRSFSASQLVSGVQTSSRKSEYDLFHRETYCDMMLGTSHSARNWVLDG